MSGLERQIYEFIENHDDLTDISDLGLYEELAPIYDAFYAKHYNYKNQAELIGEYAELKKNDIVMEGACGTGRLLAYLNNQFNAFGFDESPEMLKIASQNTNAVLFRSQLEDFFIPHKVDGFFVLGNAVYHLDKDTRKQFFKQAYNNMSNNSTFIFSFVDGNDYEDGFSDINVYEIGKYDLRRNGISVKQNQDEVTTTFSFNLSKREDGYTILKFGATIDGYIHRPPDIKSDLKNIGFTNTTIVKPDSIPHSVAVTRKVS